MIDLIASWLGTTDPVAISISLTAVVFGFYMAWTIGANDVANAMGTSVGSGTLTYRRAIILAGVMELAGAVLAGSHVTDTIRKGIIDPAMFASVPQDLALGMLAALLAAAIWLHVATWFGLPVSTTHAIVGAVIGFGVYCCGATAVDWGLVVQIALSWIISPLAGGLMAFGLFRFLRRRVLNAEDPGKATLLIAPIFAGLTVAIIVLATIYEGLKNLHLDLSLGPSIAIAVVFGAVGALVFYLVIRRRGHAAYREIEKVESVFMGLQVMTAAYVAFAHGANDVANAVGPMAAVIALVTKGVVAAKSSVPLWILIMGGVGIVIGLATWGYKVMKTIGQSITELTPTRGFCAEFATATVVLVCSKIGLPMSTTHTLVGSVLGVGFARGLEAVNLKIIRPIVYSWILTLPVGAVLTILIFYALKLIFG